MARRDLFLIKPSFISVTNILVKLANHCLHGQLLDHLLVLLDPLHRLVKRLRVLQAILEILPCFLLGHRFLNTRQPPPVDGQSLVVTDLHLAMGNSQNKSSFIPQQAT